MAADTPRMIVPQGLGFPSGTLAELSNQLPTKNSSGNRCPEPNHKSSGGRLTPRPQNQNKTPNSCGGGRFTPRAQKENNCGGRLTPRHLDQRFSVRSGSIAKGAVGVPPHSSQSNAGIGNGVKDSKARLRAGQPLCPTVRSSLGGQTGQSPAPTRRFSVGSGLSQNPTTTVQVAVSCRAASSIGMQAEHGYPLAVPLATCSSKGTDTEADQGSEKENVSVGVAPIPVAEVTGLILTSIEEFPRLQEASKQQTWGAGRLRGQSPASSSCQPRFARSPSPAMKDKRTRGMQPRRDPLAIVYRCFECFATFRAQELLMEHQESEGHWSATLDPGRTFVRKRHLATCGDVPDGQCQTPEEIVEAFPLGQEGITHFNMERQDRNSLLDECMDPSVVCVVDATSYLDTTVTRQSSCQFFCMSSPSKHPQSPLR